MSKVKLEIEKDGKVYHESYFDSKEQAEAWAKDQMFHDEEGKKLDILPSFIDTPEEGIEFRFKEFKKEQATKEEKCKDIIYFIKFYLKDLLLKDVVNKSQASQFKKSITKPLEESLLEGDLDEAKSILLEMPDSVFLTASMKQDLLKRVEF